MAEYIAAAALEKKAGDITILDLRKLETLTDYFVICTGDVDQHVRAIVDHIEKEMRVHGERVLHREGMESLNWVLLDYVNVVVHVFRPSFREFYRLEDLWGDAEVKHVVETAKPKASGKKPVKAAVEAQKSTKTKKPTAEKSTRAAHPKSVVQKTTKPKEKASSASKPKTSRSRTSEK